MKSNSVGWRSLGVVLLGLLSTKVACGQLQSLSDGTLASLATAPQLSADAVPLVGNFYSLAHPEWPPLPCNIGLPVWQIGPESYVVDDATTAAPTRMSAMSASISSPPDFGSGGGATPNDSPYTPPDISNYAKYAAQAFLVIDTNDPAIDPNLLNACASFSDTNADPTLQIAQYQPGCLVFKTSHFDYSSDTRNFALVVCDKLDTPLFKNIDISNPANNVQNGGWLVQGSVASWQVTDPMFLVVSNISRTYNAFFRVIPYSGATVQLTGPNPYDMVSNTIALQVSITDLSGVTNEAFGVTVDGLDARYHISTNNSVVIETSYNPNGPCTIYANTLNSAQIVGDMTNNPPGELPLTFAASASLPVDFENDTYMLFPGDYSSTNVGTTYSLFVINKAQDIAATIYDPRDGHLVASFSGHVPYPATVEIPWNFTEANGVTPYADDTYVVHFIAYDPATFNVTNHISRHGVRIPGRNIVTYEYEDPNVSIGSALNAAADRWVYSLELGLYENLYDRHIFSQTQYTPGQIGVGRENDPNALYPWILQPSNETTWGIQVGSALGDWQNSDFTYYSGHANGTELGGGPPGSHYVNTYLEASAAARCVHNPLLQDWRIRKVCLWGCYTEADPSIVGGGIYTTWAQAFGIQKGSLQISGFTPKNVGLFFHGGFPQAGYQSTFSGASVEVATQFDMLWVCGPNQYPGGCDPTYAFSWALSQTRAINPELDIAHSEPTLEGFPYLPYAGVYEDELMTNDIEHVKIH